MWFTKRTTIFKRKDKAVWQEDSDRAKSLLASHRIDAAVDDDVAGKLGRV